MFSNIYGIIGRISVVILFFKSCLQLLFGRPCFLADSKRKNLIGQGEVIHSKTLLWPIHLFGSTAFKYSGARSCWNHKEDCYITEWTGLRNEFVSEAISSIFYPIIRFIWLPPQPLIFSDLWVRNLLEMKRNSIVPNPVIVLATRLLISDKLIFLDNVDQANLWRVMGESTIQLNVKTLSI